MTLYRCAWRAPPIQTLAGNAAGNIHIWRVDDGNIWVNYTRAEPIEITLTAIPIGSGAMTGGQQGTGFAFVENVAIAGRIGLTEGSLSVSWDSTPQIGVPLTADSEGRS